MVADELMKAILQETEITLLRRKMSVQKPIYPHLEISKKSGLSHDERFLKNSDESYKKEFLVSGSSKW